MKIPILKFVISKKTILPIVVVLICTILILLCMNVVFWHKAGRETLFIVDSGTGTRQIAKNLQKEKLISSDLFFSGFVYLRHWYLQNGVYRIKANMNLAQIATMIHSGRVEEYLITIPEGWRASQIDELLAQKNILKKGEFLKVAGAKEGYLFPDTYRLPVGSTAQGIEQIMLDNFTKKTSGLKIDQQTLIIASIVERESKLDSDRASIASVYLNRLSIGMKLDSDPTIQYGKGDWAPILKVDYKNFQSPYNTYLHAGLPPTPISNPGLKSIKAVINPAKTNYFYFFNKSDGQSVFSKTYDEHLANLQKYR
ncbi:MAG: endolytic transglycosylase MltG [Candidatus Berkelbacteria bacterium]